LNIMHARRSACGSASIENAYAAALLEKRSDQMMPYKTTAARNER